MLKVKVISLPYIFQVLYVLCFTRPRYQVSVYRTIGPLVIAELLQIFRQNFYSNTSCFSLFWLYLGNSQVSVYRTIGPTLVN